MITTGSVALAIARSAILRRFFGKTAISFSLMEDGLTTQTERPRSCWQANGRNSQSGSIQCLVRAGESMEHDRVKAKDESNAPNAKDHAPQAHTVPTDPNNREYSAYHSAKCTEPDRQGYKSASLESQRKSLPKGRIEIKQQPRCSDQRGEDREESAHGA
jgi:hypothetical protein